MIKAIIFDFGGVILKHKPAIIEDILRDLFPNNLEKALLLWKKNKSNLYTGSITTKDFIKELKSNIPTVQTDEELQLKWKELYEKEASVVDQNLIDFIERLRKRYKVYLFTDTIELHDEYNSQRRIYEKFDAVYKSFVEKVAKYNGKAALLTILKKISVSPEECVFIDDLAINVERSREVGMQGIIYRDLFVLRKELAQQGVIV